MNQCPRCGFEVDDSSDIDTEAGEVCEPCLEGLSGEEVES